ncbi:penicillin-binding protein activator [Candidatus Woesearchaeota archaeon]|nr:penicillin-binding protein activator [Candidatus Woesearchaeota archaeon]
MKLTNWCMIVLLVLASCASPTGNIANNEPIHIGSILILSGEGASWGIAAKNGIDIAVEKINAEGGIGGRLVSIDHQDDKSDPKIALSAFENLVQTKGINIIIGTTWSRSGLALVQQADQNQVLMISPSLGVKEFNEGSKFLFNTWPHDFILSEKLAELVFSQGHRNVAVFGQQEVWVQDQTNAFKRRFEELGGTVSVLLEPAPSDVDLRADAAKVRDAKVDAVVLTNGVVNAGVIAAKRIRELGIDLPFYSMSLDANIVSQAGEAYEGLVFPTFLTPTKEFTQEYKQKFGLAPDIGADSAFDAVMMLAHAMNETGSTDPAVLKDALANIKEWNGASGHLVSDGKRGFIKGFALKKVQNGKIVDA